MNHQNLPENSPGTGPVLAIESSCDETACAILSAEGACLAQRVVSQDGHADFGGVVPEIAARAHLALLPGLVQATLKDAGMAPQDIGFVAASTGPGLIGGLIVGASFAKGLALSLGKPFVAVNHVEAHALTARLRTGAGRGGLPLPVAVSVWRALPVHCRGRCWPLPQTGRHY